jgi:YVTN family beta-propeller protein
MGFLSAAPQGASAQDYLYSCAQDAGVVYVIDTGTNEVVAQVDFDELGFGPVSRPHHVVVEPDGSFWYVSLIGANRVLKLTRDNRLAGVADFEVPGMLALDPVQTLLYVGRSMSAVNPPERIGVIDRYDMSIIEADVFFPRPHAIGVGPAGRVAYSASMATNQIGSLDLRTERLDLIDVPGPAHSFMQFAISPDGRSMVLTGHLSGLVLFYDLADPAKPAFLGQVSVGAQPWTPVFSLDGRWIYVPSKLANSVSVIDAASREVVKVIEGEALAEPDGSAVSPDGRWVYISNSNTAHGGHEAPAIGAPSAAATGSVVVIDAETRAIVKVIETGANATGLGARRPR